MSGDKIYSGFMALPPMAKGIITVTVTGCVILIGYKIFSAINKTDEEKADKKFEGELDTEIKKARLKYTPSYPTLDYYSMADLIHKSIKVCLGDDYGTAEETLKKMKNDLDVLLLMDAFGERQSYCFAIPVDTYKLIPFIRKELGQEWGGLTDYRVRRINADWKKKGITKEI